MSTSHPPINKLTVREPTKVLIDDQNTMSRDDLQKCLDGIERLLNLTKSKLDPLFELPRGSEDANRWMQVQNLVDLYKGLRSVVTRQYGGKNVSNSWLKYYEIFNQFPLFDQSRQYRCFFNAELPGGSLCALMHYMKVNEIQYKWKASSLLGPSHTGGTSEPLGDVYGMYAKNKDNWVMDADGKNNGDMTDKVCIEDLEKRFGQSFDFYSSDAGIDVSYRDDKLSFNDQESHNLRLHIGCGLAGLLMLAPGGCMVLKQYTMFKPLSWWVIMQYVKCFKGKCTIYKPLSSRPFNSELYLVFENFVGITDEIRSSLFAAMDLADAGESPQNLPEEVPRALCLFAKTVYERQINFINENIWLMRTFAQKDKMNVIRAALKSPAQKSITHWIKNVVGKM